MRRTVVGGFLYWAFLALSTSFGTFFMLIPLLPLMFVAPKYFRKLSDTMITIYLSFVVASMELVYDVKVIVSGDKIESSLSSNNLLIMNHRTRLDWMFFWCCLYRQSILSLHNLKISLKSPLKHFPGLGWATQFAAYIFMERSLDKDKVILENTLDYYKRVEKPINLLFFVEGTDKCPNATRRSHAYADKNNLPRYEYVIHPRVSGFSYVLQLMSQGDLDSLYDITVGYRDSIPQGELDIVKGNFPQEVHFHVKRYKKEELPEGEEALQEYCKELWKAKEDQLCTFYNGEMKPMYEPGEEHSEVCSPPRNIWQWMTLVYWIPFTILSLYLTCTNSLVLSYVIICVISLVICGKYFGGLDNIQTRL